MCLCEILFLLDCMYVCLFVGEEELPEEVGGFPVAFLRQIVSNWTSEAIE